MHIVVFEEINIQKGAFGAFEIGSNRFLCECLAGTLLFLTLFFDATKKRN